MLLRGFLFVGLKFMQWIGLPSSTFGETCETKGYLCSINSSFLLQIKIAYWLFKLLVFLKYCVSQNWGDIWKKRRCHLTFICVLKNVMWHFGFEVERQMWNVDAERTFWCMIANYTVVTNGWSGVNLMMHMINHFQQLMTYLMTQLHRLFDSFMIKNKHHKREGISLSALWKVPHMSFVSNVPKMCKIILQGHEFHVF